MKLICIKKGAWRYAGSGEICSGRNPKYGEEVTVVYVESNGDLIFEGYIGYYHPSNFRKPSEGMATELALEAVRKSDMKEQEIVPQTA